MLNYSVVYLNWIRLTSTGEKAIAGWLSGTALDWQLRNYLFYTFGDHCESELLTYSNSYHSNKLQVQEVQ